MEDGPPVFSEQLLRQLGDVVGASANQLAKGAKLIAGSVDTTREAMATYTDKLCNSLDAFRQSMDRSSRTMAQLTLTLIIVTLVYAVATVAQVFQ